MRPEAKSPRERITMHRHRMRAAGLKSLQIWVPDPQTPGFVEECRRQSRVIQNDPAEKNDLESLAALADWGDE
jgi:hypothetical protein